MLKILGWFIFVLGEFYEMSYQYDRPYFFNSQKFTTRFPDFHITTYREGVNNILNS
ncbi:MAG: hypothetical protein R2822_06230 [Spirosomataceae bacterium]